MDPFALSLVVVRGRHNRLTVTSKSFQGEGQTEVVVIACLSIANPGVLSGLVPSR